MTFLGIANLEGDNIRRQYLSKILPPKLVPFTKDVSKPLEYLLGNNLNVRIGTIETSQKRQISTRQMAGGYRESHGRESIKIKQENKLLKIISGYILFASSFYSLYLLLLFLLNMADAENETHSGNLPILQPLPPTHFVNEKARSSQKQQQKPDLQTCINNTFQLFLDTLTSRLEDLTSKIVEKGISRATAKGKRRRKDRQSDDEILEALNRHHNQKVSLRSR